MFLLKLESELQNLIKKFQSVLKIKTKKRLHLHEVECIHPSPVRIRLYFDGPLLPFKCKFNN